MKEFLYADMSLSEIYNRLSKANKTPAWQRAIMSERFRKKNLAKGRGEDARQKYSDSGASQYSERDFPTGQMTETGTDDPLNVHFPSHLGVFGEKRHILVETTNLRDATRVRWLQVMPGTRVEPHHVTQIFGALRNAGYTGPMTWSALKDHDERSSGRSVSSRDRLFRPLAEQWKNFVAAQQGKSAKPAEPAVSKSYKTPAWQRAEGQNPKGGLNAKGRASAKAEGHNLKPPVKSGDNPRRASFLARMGNSPGPEYDEHGKPTRLLLSLQAWGASSKADARKKAKAISARLKEE
jgi:hypothetical protein